MAARSESEAMKGQFFNAFLALSLRVIPLIGIGLVCISLYRTPDMQLNAESNLELLDDPVYAWGYLLKHTMLPPGVLGFLIATEVAAYMSTLSTLINWGSSFIVNDFFPKEVLNSKTKEVLASRLTTLLIFMAAAVVSVLFVNDMISWFVFINSAMVIFLLPLAWFRFFWWRFNVWGELSAVVVGLPFSIIVWFVLDYQNKSMAEGLTILLVAAIIIQVVITLVTPAESEETLADFYNRCRPPGYWGPIKKKLNIISPAFPRSMLYQSFLGIVTCLGLAILTNALYANNQVLLISGICIALIPAYILIRQFSNRDTSGKTIEENR
jgi:Na+/proline symporter